jgi:hypothetical protein
MSLPEETVKSVIDHVCSEWRSWLIDPYPYPELFIQGFGRVYINPNILRSWIERRLSVKVEKDDSTENREKLDYWNKMLSIVDNYLHSFKKTKNDTSTDTGKKKRRART